MKNKPNNTDTSPYNGFVVEEAPAMYQRSAPTANPYKELRTRYGFKQAEMQRVIGISLRNLSALETSEKQLSPQDRRRLREIETLLNELSEVIEPSQVHRWMTQPNNYFDGATPLQMIERGDVEQIWRLVLRLQHGIPLE